MPRQLTVRDVPDDVARRLEEASRNRGTSVNRLIVDILSSAVGSEARRQRFARFATWTKEDFDEFQRATEDQRTIDDALWK